MSIFAHKDDKGKYNLGNEADITATGASSPFAAIKSLFTRLKANNKDFTFAYDSTSQKYGYEIDGTFYPFRNPVGTKSITANGTYDVTDYASAVVNVATSIGGLSLVSALTGGSGVGNQYTASSKVLAVAVAYNFVSNGATAAPETSLSCSGTLLLNHDQYISVSNNKAIRVRTAAAILTAGQAIALNGGTAGNWGFGGGTIYAVKI